MVFKKRRRKNSRKKYGHRQLQSLIKITKILKDGKIIAQSSLPKKINADEVKKSVLEKKEEKPTKIVKNIKKKSVITKKK